MHLDSVLVRVTAADVNPTACGNQAGAVDDFVDTYFPVSPGWDMGWDIAGIVEQAGLGVPEFAPGDEIISYIRRDVQDRHGG
jgi:NADPH:quinone reductase-like Zn-dependent oxidoreductase